MVVAVITEKILALAHEEPPLEQLTKEIAQLKLCMEGVFAFADLDISGQLSKDEVRGIFENRQLRRVFDAFVVNTSMPFDYLWAIIDINGDGQVSFDEFIEACIRLRGTKGKSSFLTIYLTCDVIRLNAKLERAD